MTSTPVPSPPNRGAEDAPSAAWAQEPAVLFEALGSSPERGLAAAEAARRLERFGPNALEQAKQRTLLKVVQGQLSDAMIVVLLLAAAVSGLVGDLKDTVVILVIVVLNGVIGAVQELRAERAVAALRTLAGPRARVLRGGSFTDVDAVEVVPGDVVAIEAGDVVSADARLVEGFGLLVDEAPLTGESVAASKTPERLEEELPVGDRVNMLHRGTLVTGGHGLGLVVATGMGTELGRIAGLLQEAEAARAPLQLRLSRLGRTLGLCVLGICVVVFVAGLLRGEELLLMFLTALSLAVAAIPEAMPAVVSVSLALGARKMTGRNALVRRLSAVETLGSVTTICSDKTGTLTRGEMRVEVLCAAGERREALPPLGAADERGAWARLGAAMALNADVELDPEGALKGDPTEVALVEAARAAGSSREELARSAPRVAEAPFVTERRRMSTVHSRGAGEAGFTVFVKGAPEAVLERCRDALGPNGTVEALDAEARRAEAEELAAEGYRVLAFALRGIEGDPTAAVQDPDALESELTFLGLVALLDPPRDEAAGSVARCRTAGIRPVMITGDHPGTALAIARRLGIAGPHDEALTGAELDRLARGGAEDVAERVARAPVFARVSPEQKLSIVETLQARGEFVAMTGDGVNDAPALKRAEIGIAMGIKGTEVAREAADMVLLDDDFSTIVAAVREGRRVYDDIRKFIRYTMTSNSGEVWTLFLAPFLGLPLPLLPIQILWINLVTDGLPGLALAAEPEEPGIMDRPPRPPGESVFAHGMAWHIAWIGLLIAGLSIGGQAWAIAVGSENWQSVVFTILTLSQLVHALSCRAERASLFSSPFLSNPALLGALVLTFALQMGVLYVPVLQGIFHTAALSWGELWPCLALPLVVLVATEVEKLLARRGFIYDDGGPS